MTGSNETFLIKANEFLFTATQEGLESMNILQTSPTEFNIIKDHRSVTGKVKESGITGKKLQVEVGGEVF